MCMHSMSPGSLATVVDVHMPRKRTTRKTASQKQSDWSRAYERRLIESGSRRMPGGMLPPEAAAALDALMHRGYEKSYVRCVSRALIEAARSNR